MSIETTLWIGIAFCLSQSAMFSGLNLAFFSLSRLQLEVESKNGNKTAKKILELRQDSNFLLTTILWGNVSINVLLTLLSDSALAGISAFLFSTVFYNDFRRNTAAGVLFTQRIENGLVVGTGSPDLPVHSVPSGETMLIDTG